MLFLIKTLKEVVIIIVIVGVVVGSDVIVVIKLVKVGCLHSSNFKEVNIITG